MHLNHNQNAHFSRQSLWTVRLLTFVLATCLACSALYWVFSWPESQNNSAVIPEVQLESGAEGLNFNRLLDPTNAVKTVVSPAIANNRYRLVGVLSVPGPNGQALISINDKPAKSYRIGQVVDEDLVLQSVAGRTATLAKASVAAPTSMELQMTPLR